MLVIDCLPQFPVQYARMDDTHLLEVVEEEGLVPPLPD